MKILREFVGQLLSELKIIDHRADKDDSYTVLTFGPYLWLLDTDIGDAQEAARFLAKELPEDVSTQIEEEGLGTDWLFGIVADNELYLQNLGMGHDPKSSLLVKKVVKQLNLGGVERQAHMYDEDPEFTQPEDILGKIPSVMYHGTTSNALLGPSGILRVGLRPGSQMGKSNWQSQGVWHDKVVSLISTIDQAKFHALNAVSSAGGAYKGGFPIIIGFNIPDPKRIVADYDVDYQTGMTTYPQQHKASQKQRGELSGRERQGRVGRGPRSTSSDVGVVGYEGRIPAKFIDGVTYFSPNEESWKQIESLEQLKTMQQMFEDHGPEYIEMDPEAFLDDEY